MKNRFVCLAVLIFLYNLSPSLHGKHSRKKRLLHFPEKTNVVLTMSLLKLLPSETIVNTLTEFDVLFPVPLHPYVMNSRLKREIERKIVYDRLRSAVEHLGFNGNLYFELLICKIAEILKEKSKNQENLLKDIFDLLFDTEGRLFQNCTAK